MTRSTVAGSARFRQRKLSTRQALQILREDEVDQVDDETQRNITKVDTGVEKGEEIVSRCLLSHPLCDMQNAFRLAFLGEQTDIPPCRNTICKLRYRHLKPLPSVERLLRYIFPPQMLSRARSTMTVSTLSPSPNPPHISVFLPPWRIAAAVPMIWMMRTMAT